GKGAAGDHAWIGEVWNNRRTLICAHPNPAGTILVQGSCPAAPQILRVEARCETITCLADRNYLVSVRHDRLANSGFPDSAAVPRIVSSGKKPVLEYRCPVVCADPNPAVLSFLNRPDMIVRQAIFFSISATEFAPE